MDDNEVFPPIPSLVDFFVFCGRKLYTYSKSHKLSMTEYDKSDLYSEYPNPTCISEQRAYFVIHGEKK